MTGPMETFLMAHCRWCGKPCDLESCQCDDGCPDDDQPRPGEAALFAFARQQDAEREALETRLHDLVLEVEDARTGFPPLQARIRVLEDALRKAMPEA